MTTNVVENEPKLPELPNGSVDLPEGSTEDGLPIQDVAIALAVHSASSVLNSVGAAFRLTARLGGAIISPVKSVVDGSAMEPVRSHFDQLVTRGEEELDGWIQSGQAEEENARRTTKKIMDRVVEEVVDYLSTNASVQKLIQDQIDLLAKDSPEMPQINVLVRVLADNYITYLNENPDQVKQLVRNQADVYIDHLQENPEQVQELVQGQSVSMVAEINDEVRERLVTGDSALEALVRRLFRRRPRYELPEPPAEIKARALQARLPGDFPRLEAMRHDE